ncbi:calcium-binding tyrosine phosphorylation-regulated protein isoform B [Alligator mississippiensis]|uniref:Calcium-binding tyrosine phosphorylation-regulated protein n=1 Tax=Alligator mississippiensis TaxID=8496 RepID=A0A151PHL7_ALLMI|nr:calcium-binding tyrosine phosphorylation-regulated protein isoform B [Alligator mississippiensis]
MYTAKPRLVVPYGLKTLLEGLTRAILKCNPSNIPEFAALYFRELIAFRGEHPNVDIIDLVREFHFAQVDGLAERLSEKKTEARDKFTPEANVASPLFDEPKQKEKSTDTEEDQLLEGPSMQNVTLKEWKLQRKRHQLNQVMLYQLPYPWMM